MSMHKTALALLAVVLPASSGAAEWICKRGDYTLAWDLRADVARLTLRDPARTVWQGPLLPGLYGGAMSNDPNSRQAIQKGNHDT
jgi:hypothetical protein